MTAAALAGTGGTNNVGRLHERRTTARLDDRRPSPSLACRAGMQHGPRSARFWIR